IVQTITPLLQFHLDNPGFLEMAHGSLIMIGGNMIEKTEGDGRPMFAAYEAYLKSHQPPDPLLLVWMYEHEKAEAAAVLARVYAGSAAEGELRKAAQNPDREQLKNDFLASDQWWKNLYAIHLTPR